MISPNSSIVCFKNISVGNNVRISWETILMDTDFHKIKDMKGSILNPPKPIKIGNNVWIGMRASIMKGTHVYDNVIVGARSYLNKPIRESNCLIAGNPAKILKRKVTWTP
jgi:acetyltransferase-like isoleucine patch superfamily enzyme